MRPCFTDFDGVCNSDRFDAAQHIRPVAWLTMSSAAQDRSRFDPLAIARLNRITALRGVVIVVSSTWREHRTFAELRAILRDVGVTAPVVSTTPVLAGRARGDEIRAWLRDHPRVRRYVVLDDRGDMHAVRRHLVQTDARVGLTDADVARALAILRG